MTTDESSSQRAVLSSLYSHPINIIIVLSPAERQKRYRQRHPEKIKQAKKKYNNEHKDKVRQWSRGTYSRHKEKRLAHSAKWQQNHPENRKAIAMRYYQSHKQQHHDAVMARNRFIHDFLVIALGGKCVWHNCGTVENLEIDHKHGGGHAEVAIRFKGSWNKMWRYYSEHIEEANERLQVLCHTHNMVKKYMNKENGKTYTKKMNELMQASYGSSTCDISYS